MVQIGLERERVRMFNMSSAMAGEFASAATEMAGLIAQLGQNPLSGMNLRPDDTIGLEDFPPE